jgi:hypothetical protein
MAGWRWIPLPFALALVAVPVACGEEFLLEPPAADGGIDGAKQDDGGAPGTCEAVSCGGVAGRCGQFTECGLTVKCGECAAPATCEGSTCRCAPATCAELKATCGDQFLNACDGGTIPCGTCSATSSCQRSDAGGYGCVDGTCDAEAPSITCANKKCGSVTNNCAEATTCTCSASELCGASTVPKTCGCTLTLEDVPLWQRTEPDNDVVHCFGQGDCEGKHNAYAQISIAFKVHKTQLPDLVALRRCFLTDPVGNTLLTTAASCPAGSETAGIVGYCAKTAGVCNSQPLYRFRYPPNEDRIYALTTTPPLPDYILDPSPATPICYVWP